MSAKPDAVAREWFEQVWNKGSEAAIERLLASNAVMHGLPTPDGKPVSGPAAFKPFWQTFRSAFPDIRIEVVKTVTEGDYVVAHCHVLGNHLGAGLAIAATQRHIDMWGMGMARVQDGKIVEAWNCFDFMSLYQQIGLLPAV